MDSFKHHIGKNVDEVDLDESSDFILAKIGYWYKNCGMRYSAQKLKLSDLDYFDMVSFSDLFSSEVLFIIWYECESRIITDLEIYYLSNDFDVLFRDYYKILSAVRSGNAHNLREGDTRYLGASRLSEKVPQPNSDKLANKREIVLKKKYLDRILGEISIQCK